MIYFLECPYLSDAPLIQVQDGSSVEALSEVATSPSLGSTSSVAEDQIESDFEIDAFTHEAADDDIEANEPVDEPQLAQAQETDKDSIESPRSTIHSEESLLFESDEVPTEEKRTIPAKILCGVADTILMGEISQEVHLQSSTRGTDEPLVTTFGKVIHECARDLGIRSLAAGQPTLPLSHEMLKAIERHRSLSKVAPDKQMLLFDLYNEVLGSLLREYPAGTTIGCDHLVSRAARTLAAWSNKQSRSFSREVEAVFKSYRSQIVFQEKLATDITQDVVDHLMQDCAYTLINCNV